MEIYKVAWTVDQSPRAEYVTSKRQMETVVNRLLRQRKREPRNRKRPANIECHCVTLINQAPRWRMVVAALNGDTRPITEQTKLIGKV